MDRIIVLFLMLVFIPAIFINFDPHHDGLILTTVKLTENAINQGGSYPFNQYGPFWALPFVLVANLAPDNATFLMIRVLTLLFYFISTFLLWKISRVFLSEKKSNIVLFLFLCSQPFNTDLGSNLVPWPSALSMVLTLITSYLILKIIDFNCNHKTRNILMYVVGLIIPLILTTRVQVGILFIFSVFYIIIKAHIPKLIAYFMSGLLTASCIFLLFLSHLNWLQDSLFDLFIYGSTYLTGEKSTYPLPVYTIIGTIAFVALMFFGPRFLGAVFELNFSNKIFFITLCITLIITAFFLMMISRDISITDTGIYAIRRFWITLSLASLILATITILFSTKLQSFENTKNYASLKYKALTLFAVSMQSQIFPLFDQMHFWWGSPLVFILVVIIIFERFGTIYSKISSLFPVRAATVTVLLLSVVIPFSSMVSKEKVSFPPELFRYLYVDKPYSAYQNDLQSFFNNNIKNGSRVLNLCADTDIFFQDNKFIPASRFFVYWAKPMSSLVVIENSFINSSPDVIVTCQSLLRPAISDLEENLQKSLVNKIYTSDREPIHFKGDKEWTIYLNH